MIKLTRRILSSLRARWNLFRCSYVSPLPEVIVNSPGGVATTFFMDFVRKHKSTNHPGDKDGLKHLPGVPRIRPNVRYLYLYGDPAGAVISLARRGFLDYQIRKNGTWMPCTEIHSPEAYLQAGKDLLRLIPLKDAWQGAMETNPSQVMIIPYDSLWDRMEEWGDFLKLSPQALEQFPPRRERRPHSSPETHHALHELYQKLQNRES